MNDEIDEIHGKLLPYDAFKKSIRINYLQGVKNALKRGVMLNEKDASENTPLILASYAGSLEIANFFIDNGTDINAKNKYGQTAIIIASYGGYSEIVKLLIHQGVNVNVQNNKGTTALIAACKFGYIDIVKLLIDNGAEINTQNENGRTAIINASRYDHLDIVKFLYNKGANIFIKDNNNWDAIKFAKRKDIVEYLKSRNQVLGFNNIIIDSKHSKNWWSSFIREIKEANNFLCSENYIIDYFESNLDYQQLNDSGKELLEYTIDAYKDYSKLKKIVDEAVDDICNKRVVNLERRDNLYVFSNGANEEEIDENGVIHSMYEAPVIINIEKYKVIITIQHYCGGSVDREYIIFENIRSSSLVRDVIAEALLLDVTIK